MKNVLVLGAGLVSRPLVHYLLEKGYEVVCADLEVSKANQIIAGHPRGRAEDLDLKDEAKLSALIAASDLTVSLVPPPLHPTVAKHCIAQGKPMVLSSYVSPELAALDEAAKSAGLTILAEIGADPGLDHMSAMRIIDDVKGRGGKIVSFKSYCGGLPSPADNDNPFGYKFSWSPRGVLIASKSGAHYLDDGRRVDVAPERLFRDMRILQIDGFGDFESYPNRDSISYESIYGLEGIGTLFRGTLRNMGWCDCIYNYRALGLLETDEIDVAGMTYADLMRSFLGAGKGEDLPTAAARKMKLPVRSLPVSNLDWLGMFSEREFTETKISLLDALGNLMFERLAFAEGERDMLILFHEFIAEYAGGKRERITSQLIEFGIEGGDSSMSRAVGLPAAIGVRMILEGELKKTGVLRPVTPEIYNPVLDELATLGIECEEKTESY